MDFKLKLPFNGEYGITFGFGAIPESEDLKKKYQEWGLTGHNGLDYGLPIGTEVVASANGKVIQSGENSDFGISVTLQHDFGQTIYAHLSETKVNVDDESKAGDVIGLSGESGNVTGPHLHLGIKLNDADESNGYLGYSDPTPYFSNEAKPEEKQPEEKPAEQPPAQEPPTEQPKVEEPKPEEKKEEVKPPEIKEVIKEVPVEVIKEVVKEVPVVDQAEVQKQVEQKLKERLLENKKKADETRAENKKDNLNKILDFLKDKEEINNQDVRDLLQVSQSTASYYLAELVQKGLLKTEKKAKATIYSS